MVLVVVVAVVRNASARSLQSVVIVLVGCYFLFFFVSDQARETRGQRRAPAVKGALSLEMTVVPVDQELTVTGDFPIA